MRVLCAHSFADDLDEIADYIRADNPGRAVTFVEEIRQVCIRIIVAHPRAGRPRPEFRSGGPLIALYEKAEGALTYHSLAGIVVQADATLENVVARRSTFIRPSGKLDPLY